MWRQRFLHKYNIRYSSEVEKLEWPINYVIFEKHLYEE